MNWNSAKRKREIMPPALTLLIMLIILCTAVIARLNLRTSEVEAQETKTAAVIYNADDLDRYDNIILTMLLSNAEQERNKKSQMSNTYIIYTNSLRAHLGKNGVKLKNENIAEIKEKIGELKNVMYIERESDFTKMSLDGRAVALDIASQIYKLCGLEMKTNLKGNIMQISDLSGNVIYNNKKVMPKYDFQLYTLIVACGMLISMLVIIIVVGKKNKLFKKEVIYDEFDEERFA